MSRLVFVADNNTLVSGGNVFTLDSVTDTNWYREFISNDQKTQLVFYFMGDDEGGSVQTKTKQLKLVRWLDYQKNPYVKKMLVINLDYPLIMTNFSSKKYGMLQTVAKTQTIRAVFIIDPEGIIRTILYYPMSTGRNLPEIKRIILALQKHDEDNVSTPANWHPGDRVVMGAPLTLEDAENRMALEDEDVKVYDWYLSMKKDK